MIVRPEPVEGPLFFFESELKGKQPFDKLRVDG
jgi:hypothetical protein